MEFEEISKKAYIKDELRDNPTILEQLIWYKMVELYEQYSKGNITLESSIEKKNKIRHFYLTELKNQNFWKELHDERYKNVRKSEDMLKDILKKENEKIPEKELIKLLIDYIVKITGIVPIKTSYKSNYEVD